MGKNDVIDIEAREETREGAPTRAELLSVDDPVATAMRAIITSSDSLLTAVLKDGDVAAAKEEVCRCACDLAIALNKRKGETNGEVEES